MASLYFEEEWLAALAPEGVTPPPDSPPPPPPPDSTTGGYRITANFSADTFYGAPKSATSTGTEARNYRDALIAGYNADAIAPPIENIYGTFPHFNTRISSYSLRGPKRYVNTMRVLQKLTGDPAWLKPQAELVQPVVDYLKRTDIYSWVSWPSGIPLPGAVNGSGIVTDTFSSDYNKLRWNGFTDSRDNGGSREMKGAYRRWVAWGSDTDRRAPWQRSNSGKLQPEYKKILYLHMAGQYTILSRWGTHASDLDALLGHAWLAWTGYIMDLHRDLSTQYADIADTLYDYINNHWVPSMVGLFGARSTTTGVIPIDKALHHAAASHANLYQALVEWKKLPNTNGRTNRPAASDPLDVKAAKYMMDTMFDQFTVHQVPSGLPGVANSQSYQILHYGHQNNAYQKLIGNSISTSGAGDTTYDSEFGTEIMSLFVHEAVNNAGRKFTEADFQKLSFLFGQVVERPQTPGTQFDNTVAMTVANGYNTDADVKNGITTTQTNFKHYSRYDTVKNQYTVNTRFGGVNPRPETGASGYAQHAFNGGLYHWADPTPERANQFAWLLRCRYNQSSGQRITPQGILADPTGTLKNRWQAISCFLIYKLLKPNQTLTDINTNGYTT